MMLNTPEGIEYAGYAALKMGLKMEKVGMKHSAMKGKALRPMWAAKLGLKPRDHHDVFIAEVQSRMDAMLPKAVS